MKLENYNFLSQMNFRFTIDRAKNVNFFVQAVEFPGLQGSVPKSPTPFVSIPLSGSLDYEPLQLTFRVDENMRNYREIESWMKDLFLAESHEGYKALSAGSTLGNNRANATKYGLTSDLNLVILTSSMNPSITINFYDAFPTNLSGLTLTHADADVNYIEAEVTFEYLRYEFAK